MLGVDVRRRNDEAVSRASCIAVLRQRQVNGRRATRRAALTDEADPLRRSPLDIQVVDPLVDLSEELAVPLYAELSGHVTKSGHTPPAMQDVAWGRAPLALPKPTAGIAAGNRCASQLFLPGRMQRMETA